MIEISDKLKEYFGELSPRDRRLMFEELEESGQLGDLDDEAREFCRTLYYERYTDKKDPEHRVDNWLWLIVFLSSFGKRKLLFGGTLKREAASTLAQLHLSDASSVSETESTILYYEYRNAAKRYLSTCGNPNYGSTFLGLKKVDDDQKKLLACEDIWRASRGFAIIAGEEKNLKLWCDALYDELLQYDSSLGSYYVKLEEKNRR